MDNTIKKYFPAILPIIIIIITFLTSSAAHALTPGDLWQLAALVAGAVVTYFVPLVDNTWKGVLKTGAAIVAAAATAAIPLLTQGHLNLQNWLIIILAALSALATEIGVQVHAATVTSQPTVNDPVVTDPEYAVDPGSVASVDVDTAPVAAVKKAASKKKTTVSK